MLQDKVRGIIDPFTLGFILAFIGGGAMTLTQSSDSEQSAYHVQDDNKVEIATTEHLESEFPFE